MKIANKQVTATRLVKEALEKAKYFEEQGYNIFTSLCEERALERAAEIDARIAHGESVGRLAGVPFAAKDNFLTEGDETTASAHILNGFVAPLTATSVAKLEAEGAILIGHTNCDAFAHGSSTENSYYGPTLNAHDRERVAGGSSGGSAVAVALDIVPFATGSDTGGSIRQPASFNGIYGFKPTYGTISRYGVVAMASSTDCVGFFARSASDIDLLMEIASGRDKKDMTTLEDYYVGDAELGLSRDASSRPSSRGSSLSCSSSVAKTLEKPNSRVGETSNAKIGIIKDFDNDSVAPEIREALKHKRDLLRERGHEIVELEMPTLKYALAAYYIIVPAEVASNLSRYDGIRYGWRAEDARDLQEIYEKTRDQGFMPENKRRIMIGNFVLSSGFYDAYFLKAAKARTLIVEEYAKAFEKCDFLLTPVSPNCAFKLGEKVNDPVAMYLEDMMSVSLNLAGVPGLAVPAGKRADGLPVGLQLVGPRRSDKKLLAFAKELEEEE